MKIPTSSKHLATLAALLLGGLGVAFTTTAAHAATSVTHHNITWTFDKDYKTGTFINGDPWVLGPVKIVSITNDLNDKNFEVADGVNGSMINPKVTPGHKTELDHGFDYRINGYIEELNAALPNGKPVAKDNPLELKPNQSLISAVSWLWRGRDDREPGCPPVDNGVTIIATPTLRTAAVLTCFDKAPPDGSFRPPYTGDDKTIKFNVKDIKFDRLHKFDPVPSICDGPAGEPGPVSIHTLERATERVWKDFVPGWRSGSLKPGMNMNIYGREISATAQQAMLALHLDWDKFPTKPKKDTLAINMAQIGIDLAGNADNGTEWPADGGIGLGRYPIILFAGLLLDDEHMKGAGKWETRFHDRDVTFYVTEKDVERTNSPIWLQRVDIRSINLMPYKKELIGMPEWGIRHAGEPERSNAGWNTAYRDTNAATIPGFALVFMMMDARPLFCNEAYFDYADRLRSSGEALFNPWHNRPYPFPNEMWNTYRSKYPSTYDKKWDDQAVIDYITRPKFSMQAGSPFGKGDNTFPAGDPVRMNFGFPVDTTVLTTETVTVTLKNETIPVKKIVTEGKTADHFLIEFADGLLKPGETYTVSVSKDATADWRCPIGLPLMSNGATFRIR